MHRKRGFIVVLVFAPLAAILIDHAFAQQPARPPVGFFITSSTSGTGDLGGLAGADKRCQTLAMAAGAGNRTWRAYLRYKRRRRRQCARPRWLRTLVQREGCPDRTERRRAPLRQGEHQQRHRARRAGPDDQFAGCAEPSRYPHRLDDRRPRNGDDLSELDEQRRRRGDGRPSRSTSEGHTGVTVELGACVAGLLCGKPAGLRWCRPRVLFRG